LSGADNDELNPPWARGLWPSQFELPNLVTLRESKEVENAGEIDGPAQKQA
jgi:hypothetical protein